MSLSFSLLLFFELGFMTLSSLLKIFSPQLGQTHLSPMEGHVKMKGTAPGGSPTGVGEKPAYRDSPGYTAQ